jgi:gamma-glutamyltranspeptidase
MVVGTPGGPTIITQVYHVISNVIDHHMALGDAVAAPRMHHQALPDSIRLERGDSSPRRSPSWSGWVMASSTAAAGAMSRRSSECPVAGRASVIRGVGAEGRGTSSRQPSAVSRQPSAPSAIGIQETLRCVAPEGYLF